MVTVLLDGVANGVQTNQHYRNGKNSSLDRFPIEPGYLLGGIDQMGSVSLHLQRPFGHASGPVPGSGIISRLRGWYSGCAAVPGTFNEVPADLLDQEIPLDERTDEALLAAHLAGEDGVAYEELLGRYADELVPFLTRLTGSRAAAEDVFQETFLQIHQSARTFDPTRRFRPWLYTIAVNKGRDWHRRNSRRKALSLSANLGPDEDGSRMADLLADDGPMPGASIEISERVGSVKKVVDNLPAHLREILLLSYFQRMSYNQIADALEIPLGTVKSRLHSAVATFGRAWQHFEAREMGDGA